MRSAQLGHRCSRPFGGLRGSFKENERASVDVGVRLRSFGRMSLFLPSRYEDLDNAFRARLRPVNPLLDLVKKAHSSMKMSGGIRFLPLFGKSGSGKSSAAKELATHLTESLVLDLPRAAIESGDELRAEVARAVADSDSRLIVFVIDQYEEEVENRSAIPTAFVEQLSLLDRGEFRRNPMLFVWLTTKREFQKSLAEATTRNQRILLDANFELVGPPKDDWPSIIMETFSFHNAERPLADYEILEPDLRDLSKSCDTIGTAIENVGEKLASNEPSLQDISVYQVVMLWPVTDGLRTARVQQFTEPRSGYKLLWDALYQQFNEEDRKQLPLQAYNRTRL